MGKVSSGLQLIIFKNIFFLSETFNMILKKTVQTEKPQTMHRPRTYALELAIERGNQDKIVSPRTRRIQNKFLFIL